MALQYELVPIPFAGGLDTKTDPFQVPPGKMLAAQNAVFKQTGAISRRWGYSALPTAVLGQGTRVGAAQAIASFGEDLLLYDGTLAYSFAPAANAWVPRGAVTSLIQSNEQIISNTNQQLSCDGAGLATSTTTAVEVYAWEDSRGGIRYSVVDSSTGVLLLADQPLYAGMPSSIVRPKVLPLSTLGLILVLFATPSGTVSMVTISTANPLAPPAGPVVLASGLQIPVYYDATTVTTDVFASTGALFLAAYQVIPASPTFGTVGLWAYVQSGNQLPLAWHFFGYGQSWSGASATGTIAICYDNVNTFVWVSSADQGAGSFTGEVWAANALGGAITVPGTRCMNTAIGPLQALAMVATGGFATIYADVQGSAPSNQQIYTNTAFYNNGSTARLGTPNGTLFLRSVGLASKPFVYNGSIFLNVAYQSPLQSTYFTCDGFGNIASKVHAGLGGGLIASSDYLLPECQAPNANQPGIFKYANLARGLPNTQSGQVVSLLGVNSTRLDFVDTDHFLSAPINGGLYTVGGILQSYDGARYVEHGFHLYPEGIALTPIGSGGNLGTGTYSYAVTYEWQDNNGLTQISAPSVVATVNFASGSTNSVSVVIPTLRLTKKSNVKIVVYRSAANGLLLTRTTSALVPVYNDPTVDSITFVDTLSDAAIAGNAALYTQPLTQGNPVVPNAAPPACSLITTFADRIFLAGVDDPYTMWFSKPTTLNVPMEFSSLFTLRADPDGGPIIALARMDDKLVIFKQTGIFYLTGNGPTNTGDQNDFLTIIQIPSGGVGCSTQNAVVLTPAGLLFPSSNGIYLLDRGLNVSYKGAPVEGFNALTITAATLIPNQWVVFLTTSDTAIVYDYFYDQWSTFTNHGGLDGVIYAARNLYAYAKTDGKVYLQTPTVFSDAGLPIPVSFTLSWAAAKLQGFQRIVHAYVLGSYKGTHTLNCAVAYDYDPTFVGLAQIPSDSTLFSGTFGSDPLFGSSSPFGGVTPGGSVYQFRLDLLRKCQSMQLQFSDSQVAPGDEGFSLSAVTLKVQVKRGGHKVAPIKQFGVS